jgi:hypothetical protein
MGQQFFKRLKWRIGARSFAYKRTIVWVQEDDRKLLTFSLLPLILSLASLNLHPSET